MDDAAWGALAISLTVLGGIYTWFAFRSRGFVAGLRGGGITLIPLALLLTDTFQLVGDIGGAVGDWFLDFAFSPAAWLGIILAAIAVVCFVVAGFLADRGVGSGPERERKAARKEVASGRTTRSGPVVADVDPELAEIESLLRKRGIT